MGDTAPGPGDAWIKHTITVLKELSRLKGQNIQAGAGRKQMEIKTKKIETLEADPNKCKHAIYPKSSNPCQRHIEDINHAWH